MAQSSTSAKSLDNDSMSDFWNLDSSIEPNLFNVKPQGFERLRQEKRPFSHCSTPSPVRRSAKAVPRAHDSVVAAQQLSREKLGQYNFQRRLNTHIVAEFDFGAPDPAFSISQPSTDCGEWRYQQEITQEDPQLLLSDLPLLAVANMLSFLPLKSRLNARVACKQLLAADRFQWQGMRTLSFRTLMLTLYPRLERTMATFTNGKAFARKLQTILLLHRGVIADVDFHSHAAASDTSGVMFVGPQLLAVFLLCDRGSHVRTLNLAHCMVDAGAVKLAAIAFPNLNAITVSRNCVHLGTDQAAADAEQVENALGNIVIGWDKRTRNRDMGTDRLVLYLRQQFHKLQTVNVVA